MKTVLLLLLHVASLLKACLCGSVLFVIVVWCSYIAFLYSYGTVLSVTSNLTQLNLCLAHSKCGLLQAIKEVDLICDHADGIEVSAEP